MTSMFSDIVPLYFLSIKILVMLPTIVKIIIKSPAASQARRMQNAGAVSCRKGTKQLLVMPINPQRPRRVVARNEISLPRAKRGGSNPVLNDKAAHLCIFLNGLDCFAALAMTVFARNGITCREPSAADAKCMGGVLSPVVVGGIPPERDKAIPGDANQAATTPARRCEERSDEAIQS